MSSEEARSFLFEQSSYCSLDLPKYFDFTAVLTCARKLVRPAEKQKTARTKIRALDDVNYIIVSNKDGAYAWRPMQLIHPVLYAELATLLTESTNWKLLQSRFKDFQANDRIICTSLPAISETDSQKATAICRWWLDFEQESVRLSLDYKYIATTDITDCYGAIYTHSIAWATHTKTWAKNHRREECLGNQLDAMFQDMHEGQTNGIPQGNMISDLVAELVLGYADLELSEELQRKDRDIDYRILRHRDDYRIFTKSKEDAQEILLLLSTILGALNFKLSSPKTKLSDDIIGSSIKPDKQYANQALRFRRSRFKTLLLIRDFAQRFPNSGSLMKSLQRFRESIEPRAKRPRNNPVLIAIIADIMYRNPRVYPHAASILSKLLSFEEESEIKGYLERIRDKFADIPNTGFLDVWLQRISLNYKFDMEYGEKLCKVACGSSEPIWNSKWLQEAESSIEETSIINQEALNEIEVVIPLEETEVFTRRYDDSK
ncbi:MAG: RNA-directed DNA polymerase [Actinomycetaceae bacterium]|nr:RNA-directed DNA polymerase [Actinomycetaceae bacterium]